MNSPQNKPKPKRSRFFLMFGSLWAVLGLPFFLVGLSMYNTNARYSTEGVKTNATLVSKRIESKWNSKDKRNETYYHVTYKFTPPSGPPVEASSTVGESVWNNLSEGGPLEIEYIPTQTDLNRPTGNAEGIAAYLFLGIGSLSILFGLGFVFSHFKKSIWRTKILREGVLVEGSITSVVPSSFSVNNVTQWQLHYAFKDLQGRSLNGKSDYLSPEEAELWKSGDKGKVRFDQNKPERSIWVGNDI